MELLVGSNCFALTPGHENESVFGTTGMKQRRKKPYKEGVAIHFGPEFCVGHREVRGEA
jgi:hypothetical protein